jgi:hypothetical protein
MTTKTTDQQRTLLMRAADAEDGMIVPTDTAKPMVAALIRRGLMISTPRPEGPNALLITEAGRLAIGRAPARDPKGQREGEMAVGPDEAADVPEAPSPARKSPAGKLGKLVELLKAPEGATIEALMAASGWQAHSVRGAISGALKKKLGLTILSEKTEAGRLYRIVEGTKA